MTKAFLLLRVSSAGQTRRHGADQGYSLEMQRAACLRKAQQLEAEVVREFIAPAESASRGLYRTLRELLDVLKERGDIGYVIVYKLERFARNELTDFKAYADIKAAGAQLVSVTENIDDSPQGMLLHGILASINAFYSRDLAQKITDGRVQKAKMGGTPFRTRLGYLNKRRWDGANDIRYIELDPQRAPHIAWAFEAYDSGEWPMRALVEELYERGLRSRPTKRHPHGNMVGLSSLQRILRDPYYIGIVEFRGVQYQGDHPKLIAPDLFERVQQRLSARAHAGEHQWIHQHHLKGTVFCGLCGRRLKFTKCTGRRGGKYDYFVCAGRHDGDGCELPYLPAHLVEHHVAEYYLEKIKLDTERVDALAPRLIELFRLATGHRQREAERRRREVERLRARRHELVEKHLANPRAIPLDVLEQKQAAIGQQLKAAQRELAKAERHIGKAEEGLQLARSFLHDASRTYRDEADPETRRAWNQIFFRRLFVGPDGVAAAELTDEFGALLREELAMELEQYASNPRALLRAGGSTFERVVETAGIEPASAEPFGQRLRA
jgi:site-specific DNA recombinase